jgi:Ni/Fe-hydrogenase subunit HybB-like protein
MSVTHAEDANDIVAPGHTYRSITEKITGIVLTRSAPIPWYAGLALALVVVLVFLVAVTHLLTTGVGIWGNNVPVGWGFDITSMVWWIGIAHAGTLISAILLLFRQAWRTSINRFAEAMTLFAILCASLYPVLHVGRPWLAYWIFPLPNTLDLWPQFRSPLVWDAFAIGTYAVVSLMFWYIGLIPDLAAVRDRAKNRWARYFYGVLAMGWRGDAGHWQRYESAYLLLAALATALVISVHSVVSFDFAVSVIPGWHSTVFPPYFVAGAIFSGFAMVLTLLIPIRKIYRLEDFITVRHLDNMAKVMLATGLFVIYGYLTEAFMAWYSGEPAERFWLFNRSFGPYWWAFWALMLCNVVAPQALWFRRVRRNPILLLIVALMVDIGMWIERYVIIVGSLHRDYLPSAWGIFHGTIWDWATILGTTGLFVLLILLFIRVLPMISMFELRLLVAPSPVAEQPVQQKTGVASQDSTVTASSGDKAVLYGLMAEFNDAPTLLERARATYEAGYRKISAYSPFPIDELPAAIGLRPSRLPLLALAGGVVGALAGFALQYGIAVIANPWNIGGRPLNSWPSFIIVSFEMTILFAAGAAALGMVFSNRLPQPYHAVFNAARFRYASQDRFFLCVEAVDPIFDHTKTRQFLEGLQPVEVVDIQK